MPDHKQLIEELKLLTGGEDIYGKAADTIERLEAERELDAAVLEALTSNEAIQAATREWGQCNVDAGVKYPIPQRLKLAISAALQHAQEQVGEDRA